MVRAAMPYARTQPHGSWYTMSQAITHNSICCPNRATFLTGQTNLHNGVLGNSNCTKYKEDGYLPVSLQAAGYQTGMFGKYLNCFSIPSAKWSAPPTGWNRLEIHNGDPRYYSFTMVNEAGLIQEVPGSAAQPETYEPTWLNTQAMAWLDQLEATDDTPWLAYMTPFGPHEPAAACPGCTNPMVGTTPPTPAYREGCAGATDPSIDDKPQAIQAAACRKATERGNGKLAQLGVDKEFAKFVQHLEALGELDNTVIVLTSDNGMSLDDHRIATKACVYEGCHQISMMIRIPGQPGGVVDRMVSNLDLMPTFLHLAGAPVLRPQDGRSIMDLLSGSGTWRDDQFLWNANEGYRALRQDCAVHTPCWKYVQLKTGEEELYRLDTDPFELHQILPNPTTGYAGIADGTEPVAELRSRLIQVFLEGGGTKWP
jgi:arylsulfatase A-like enzyme